MNLITPNNQYSQKPIVEDYFLDNRNNWEIADDIVQKSIITGEGYYLENNVEGIWNYYKINTCLTQQDSFVFDVTFQVLELGNSDSAHFGLLWGFSDEAKFFNKFCYNVKESIYKASSIHKDYKWVNYHTFGVVEPDSPQKLYRLVVFKQQTKHLFFINNIRQPLNPACVIHDWHGSNFGIYIEPDIALIVKQLRVKKIDGSKCLTNRFESIIDDY